MISAVQRRPHQTLLAAGTHCEGELRPAFSLSISIYSRESFSCGSRRRFFGSSLKSPRAHAQKLNLRPLLMYIYIAPLPPSRCICMRVYIRRRRADDLRAHSQECLIRPRRRLSTSRLLSTTDGRRMADTCCIQRTEHRSCMYVRMHIIRESGAAARGKKILVLSALTRERDNAAPSTHIYIRRAFAAGMLTLCALQNAARI